jgi:predicted TIM-barrel enzyme
MEVDLIRLARERDLFTHAFCSDVEETRMMLDVGCDMIVAHMGNTRGGTTGSKTVLSMEEVAEKLQEIVDYVKESNPDVFVICHGGPVARPEDFAEVMELTENVDGFMGGSSGERFPVEDGVAQVTGEFKGVSL